MSDSEDVWEDKTAGVKLLRTSLLLRLSEGEDARQLLEEMKGHYCRKLKGWLVDFRNLKMSPFDSSGRWLNAEGEYAVFTPTPGLQMTTTFSSVEDGQALCAAKVNVHKQDMPSKILNGRHFPKCSSILKGWRLRLGGLCGGNY